MLSLVIALPAYAQNSNAQLMLEKGCQFNQTKNWPAAVSVLNQAIRLNPRLAEAYLERAAAYLEMGKYSLSVADCEKSLQIDNQILLPYVILGDCYKRMHDNLKSVENYSKFIESAPTAAQPYFDRAKVYELMGKSDLAKIDRARGSRNEVRYAERLNALATTYAITGARLTAAKTQLIRIDPYNRHNTMSHVLIEACTYQLSVAPFNRLAYLLRGRLYKQTGQVEKAIADYSQVINIPAGKGGHINWNVGQRLHSCLF